MNNSNRYRRPLLFLCTILALLTMNLVSDNLIFRVPVLERRADFSRTVKKNSSTFHVRYVRQDEEEGTFGKNENVKDVALRVGHNATLSDGVNSNANTTKNATTTATNPDMSLRTYHRNQYGIDSTFILKEDNRPLCTRDQIRDGEWVPMEFDKPPYISQNHHLRCYPRESYNVSPWKSWAWSPTDKSCQLEEWNGDQFCKLLRFGTVSIIGDSLNWEMYSSLLQLLGARVLQSSQHKSKTYKQNHPQLACDGKTRFVWRNDARLENVTDSIRNDFPNVLVLNRGAHFKNDTELLAGVRKNIEEVRDWFDICEKRQLKCHFFWRTSVPGHPGCKNFTQPVNDLAYMEERVADLSLYNNRSINYHWYDYQHQNKLVLKELEQSGLEYHVIDAYEPNMRRPDEHRAHQDDCLHSCYPGKMDVYNQLLFHFLKIHRTKDDVLRMEELFRNYVAKSNVDKRVLDHLGLT